MSRKDLLGSLYDDLYTASSKDEKKESITLSDSETKKDASASLPPSGKKDTSASLSHPEEEMALKDARKALDEARKLFGNLEDMQADLLGNIADMTGRITGSDSSGDYAKDILSGKTGSSGKTDASFPDLHDFEVTSNNRSSSTTTSDPAAPTTPAAPAAVSTGAPVKTETEQKAEESKAEPETDPMDDLDSLVGLSSIKHDVKEIMAYAKVQKMREDEGLKSVPASLHLVFTGNPGTGKTTVARIMARLYKQIGILSKGQLIECDRSGLVAGYVGQTALKTQALIQQALGGVLFIDEAYALAGGDQDSFGQEAINTILKAMEDHRKDLIVIVAGYTKPMEKFINSNPGLRSRFNKYIEFPDYNTDELCSMFDINCKKYDYTADEDVKKQVRAILTARKFAHLDNFANGREVRNLFEEIITNQARRLAEIKEPSKEDLRTILPEDLMDSAADDASSESSGEEVRKLNEYAGNTNANITPLLFSHPEDAGQAPVESANHSEHK